MQEDVNGEEIISWCNFLSLTVLVQRDLSDADAEWTRALRHARVFRATALEETVSLQDENLQVTTFYNNLLVGSYD